MALVLAHVFTWVFITLLGLGLLYLGYRRKAVAWHIIATIVFGGNTLNAFAIPFSMDAAGAVQATSSNVIMISISLLFTLIGLVWSIKLGMEGFAKGPRGFP